MSSPLSINILQRYLEPKGYVFKVRELGPKRDSFTFIQSPQGGSLVLGTNNPLYPFATSSARLIARDKLKAYDLADSIGVPTPRTATVDTQQNGYDTAIDLLDGSHSVIVKPYNAAASEGLTRDINTHDELNSALQKALSVSGIALVQEQFIGEEIRFVSINGVIETALLRRKAFIVGDGTSTIEGLIETDNVARRNLLNQTLIQYPEINETIIDNKLLHDQRVPIMGETIELNKSTMIAGGASTYNVLSTVHSTYIQAAQNLANQLGKGFVAIDMMIADYMVLADTSNHVFLEMNLNPSLALFYSCRDGNHFNIVEDHIGPMIEKAIEGMK